MTKLNLHKAFVLAILVLVALSSVIPAIQPAFAHSAEVPISIPSFNVEIDAHQRENAYQKYPVILYKEITYFPLTYYDCRSLGLDAVWTKQDGLTISKRGGEPFPLKEQKSSLSNPSSDTATVVSFPVRIMGRLVENAKEEYPLLLYRNITYVPWTWSFAQSLGAIYRFDQAKGLRILSHNYVENYPRLAADFSSELYRTFTYQEVSYSVEVDYPSIGMPWPNNLKLTKDGEISSQLGDSTLYYGILVEKKDSTIFKHPSNSLRVEPPWIYVHACNEDGTQNGLFRVHILTGETVLVEAVPARQE